VSGCRAAYLFDAGSGHALRGVRAGDSSHGDPDLRVARRAQVIDGNHWIARGHDETQALRPGRSGNFQAGWLGLGGEGSATMNPSTNPAARPTAARVYARQALEQNCCPEVPHQLSTARSELQDSLSLSVPGWLDELGDDGSGATILSTNPSARPTSARVYARQALDEVNRHPDVPKRLSTARSALQDILSMSDASDVGPVVRAALEVADGGAASAAAARSALVTAAGAVTSPLSQLMAATGLRSFDALSFDRDRATATRPFLEYLATSGDAGSAALAAWALRDGPQRSRAEVGRFALMVAAGPAPDAQVARAAVEVLHACSDEGRFQEGVAYLAPYLSTAAAPVIEAVHEVPRGVASHAAWKSLLDGQEGIESPRQGLIDIGLRTCERLDLNEQDGALRGFLRVLESQGESPTASTLARAALRADMPSARVAAGLACLEASREPAPLPQALIQVVQNARRRGSDVARLSVARAFAPDLIAQADGAAAAALLRTVSSISDEAVAAAGWDLVLELLETTPDPGSLQEAAVCLARKAMTRTMSPDSRADLLEAILTPLEGPAALFETARGMQRGHSRAATWPVVARAVDEQWAGDPAELCRRVALEASASLANVDERLAVLRPFMTQMAERLGPDRRADLLRAALEPTLNRTADCTTLGALAVALARPLRLGEEFSIGLELLDGLGSHDAQRALAQRLVTHLGLEAPARAGLEDLVKILKSADDLARVARGLETPSPESPAVVQQDQVVWINGIAIPVRRPG